MALLLVLGACAPALWAQQEAQAVLRGRALVGDSVLARGTVVLHLLSQEEEGELDSVRVADDGSFAFRLPRMPDPERSEIYFASLRHQGILYFGRPVTLPIQLDSLYLIQAWDTLAVSSPDGVRLAVQVRNVFLEPDGDDWRVTDLLQVRNDSPRTLVPSEGGIVWRYPMPEGAGDFSLGQSDLVPGGSTFEDGHLVIRSPIPPGERLFVVRYAVPDPFLEIPTPGLTETLDVLVREPAPPLEASGLSAVERIELEPGTTYRRFSGENYDQASLRLVEGRESRPPPVEWLGILLAFVLTGAGLWAMKGRRPSPAAGGVGPGPDADPDRRAVIVEIARLDAAWEARTEKDDDARSEYRRARGALLDRLR